MLCALDDQSIQSYWFSTGTPTFLVNRLKDMGTYPPDLNGVRCTREQLTAVGLNARNPIPLMFQTGYLTIGSFEAERRRYLLRFPNHEVETGFYKDLLPAYAPETDNPTSPFSIENFRDDLYDGLPEEFMKRLGTLFKDLPGEDHCEPVYRATTYLLASLCATKPVAEHHGYLGRSDIEVSAGRFLYLFEFKYNKSVKEAMDQILTRDYAGRFAMDPRTVYLIAANFSETKNSRGLQYEIRPLPK